MLKKFILLGSAALILGGSAAVRADSFSDHMGPRELALGESRRAAAYGAMSTLLNPAGLALSRQLVFDMNYGYRDSDGASIASISACDSTTPVGGCFYYRYLSANPELAGIKSKERLHEGGFTASRALSQQIILGTNTHFFDYNSPVSGSKDVRGYAIDIGLLFRMGESISVAGVGYNLIGTKADRYRRGAAIGLAVRPGQGALSIGADALWDLETEDGEKTGRYGGGVEYIFQAGQGAAYPLRAGALHDSATGSNYTTFGVGFTNAKIGLDIGGRKQVSGGGDELVVSAGLRFVGATPQARR